MKAKKITVLSLFDGMSCGQIALTELGIKISKYYASEVDKHAIKQTQLNFPNTIQLGDVVALKRSMCWSDKTFNALMASVYSSEKTKNKYYKMRYTDWSKIDLLLAGSPCQGFSFAGKMLAFDDPRSKLFFVFVDILNHIKKLNPNVKFLLENVNMKKQHLAVISEYVGLFPVRINSNLVSAQNRDRFYWSNISTIQKGLFGEVHTDIEQPKDKGIYLKDILQKEVDKKYYLSEKMIQGLINRPKGYDSFDPIGVHSDTKARCITSRCHKMGSRDNYVKIDKKGVIKNDQIKASYLTDGGHLGGNHSDMDLIVQLPRGKNKGGVHSEKTPTLSANSWEQNNLILLKNYRVRRLTPYECSLLQTIPNWYKWECSDTQQYRMLGNGWTVAIIIHIFSHLHKKQTI